MKLSTKDLLNNSTSHGLTPISWELVRHSSGVSLILVLALLEDDIIAVDRGDSIDPPLLQVVREIVHLTTKGLDAILNFHHLELR